MHKAQQQTTEFMFMTKKNVYYLNVCEEEREKLFWFIETMQRKERKT